MIQDSPLSVILMGAFFGLMAGISPGPLLALVISETLSHGRKEGIKIAFAPLITDLPIILLTWFVFSRLAQFDTALNIISLAGGLFLAFIGYETLRAQGISAEIADIRPRSLNKGIAANMLNPHPYLFWLTVGIPTAFKAMEISLAAFIFFFFLFYLMLVGSKVIIAILADRSRSFLPGKTLRIAMQILAVTLFTFAIIFFYNGIKFFLNNS